MATAIVQTPGGRVSYAGAAEVQLEIAADGQVRRAGTQRTARKLFDGRVFAR